MPLAAELVGDSVGGADPLGRVALKRLALPDSPPLVGEAERDHALDASLDQSPPIRRVRVCGLGYARAADDERLRAVRNRLFQVVEEAGHRTRATEELRTL